MKFIKNPKFTSPITEYGSQHAIESFLNNTEITLDTQLPNIQCMLQPWQLNCTTKEIT